MADKSGAGDLSTRAGRATRAALVRAAWELVDEMPLVDLVSAVRVEEVAADAGVTTGAFFHHFATRSDFVDAMVEDLLVRVDDRASLQELASLETIDAGETGSDVREEAVSFLSMVDHEEAAQTLRRMLLLWSRDGDQLIGGSPLGDQLRRHYWEPAEEAQRDIWRLVLDLAERYPLPPFDTASITLVMEALGTGFLVRRLALPELFTMDLFADSVLLMLSTMSIPIVDMVSLAELEVGLGDAITAHASDQAMRQREAAAGYAGMLESDWGSASFSDLAASRPDGPGPTELAAMFGTVRRVAAYAFYSVLEPIEWFDEMQLERDPPPRRDAIAAVVLAARAHPNLARAHALERARDTTRFGLTHSEGDVRSGIALDTGILRAHLRAEESASIRQVVEVVTAVVDAALALGLRAELDVDVAIDAVVAMLPEDPS